MQLALLLHQELNSSPRVPRVPRMRQAGSLPQLASSTPTTSTLMKRTSSSVGKDNGLVSFIIYVLFFFWNASRYILKVQVI